MVDNAVTSFRRAIEPLDDELHELADSEIEDQRERLEHIRQRYYSLYPSHCVRFVHEAVRTPKEWHEVLEMARIMAPSARMTPREWFATQWQKQWATEARLVMAAFRLLDRVIGREDRAEAERRTRTRLRQLHEHAVPAATGLAAALMPAPLSWEPSTLPSAALTAPPSTPSSSPATLSTESPDVPGPVADNTRTTRPRPTIDRLLGKPDPKWSNADIRAALRQAALRDLSLHAISRATEENGTTDDSRVPYSTLSRFARKGSNKFKTAAKRAKLISVLRSILAKSRLPDPAADEPAGQHN
jgi:hypothetical protein